MPVKIHLTEEATEGFELAQTQGYYGVKLLVRLWCVCLAVLHAKSGTRQRLFCLLFRLHLCIFFTMALPK